MRYALALSLSLVAVTGYAQVGNPGGAVPGTATTIPGVGTQTVTQATQYGTVPFKAAVNRGLVSGWSVMSDGGAIWRATKGDL